MNFEETCLFASVFVSHNIIFKIQRLNFEIRWNMKHKWLITVGTGQWCGVRVWLCLSCWKTKWNVDLRGGRNDVAHDRLLIDTFPKRYYLPQKSGKNVWYVVPWQKFFFLSRYSLKNLQHIINFWWDERFARFL